MFSFPVLLNAQVAMDYQHVDSLTYSYYNSGDWDRLIKLGLEAAQKGIDYKYLRQRIGFAFFSQGNYYDAKFQFEKARSFDSYDSFTNEYLYYSYLNTAKEEYAGVYARKLDPEIRKSLSISPFKPLESIEIEYNFKFAGTAHRSNPQYYRLGISTKLGYRLTLFQSLSRYNQVIIIQQAGYSEKISDKQPEYYALLKWSASSHLLLKTAYHYISTTSGSSRRSRNLFLFAISHDLNRLSLETSGSVLSIGQELIYQAGGQIGYVFPGRSNFYLTGTASGLFQKTGNRLIYNQKAGFKVMKKTWLEGNLTFGRMTNYNDYNGLYVYNTLDPMTFRAGSTMIFYLGKNIALWANYSFERKEYYEDNLFHYNQFSYLGGIKWRL